MALLERKTESRALTAEAAIKAREVDLKAAREDASRKQQVRTSRV